MRHQRQAPSASSQPPQPRRVLARGWLAGWHEHCDFLAAGQPLAGLFDGSSDDQQLLQRLSQCVSDDERARLVAGAIECGSTAAVAAAGADAIAGMSGARLWQRM